MKKNNIVYIVFFIFFCILLLFDIISFPCPIHFLTGLYCPGCGVTRMIKSLIKLDFYQAFRYNQLLFILSPFIIFFFLNHLYSLLLKKESIYLKIPQYVWFIVIILLIIFGILRNIFPYFAPTNI